MPIRLCVNLTTEREPAQAAPRAHRLAPGGGETAAECWTLLPPAKKTVDNDETWRMMNAKVSVNMTLTNIRRVSLVRHRAGRGKRGAMAYSYEFERPGLTVDCVIFGLDLDEESLQVMLVERDLEPFAGRWAIPGGFVRRGESPAEAAARELREETGIADVFLEQLYTFGAPGRDPRGWVVSVAYYALVSPDKHSIRAATDAREARWFPVTRTPPLAFDHTEILKTALARLRGKLTYAPVGFELLPQKFTIKQLQKLYEIVLGRQLDNRNFRKKIFGMDVLRELDEMQQGVPHRAARLYRFDEHKYKQLLKRGLSFEL